MEVNGTQIRDLPHEDVVRLIRQTSENADMIHFTVVSKNNEALGETVEKGEE